MTALAIVDRDLKIQRSGFWQRLTESRPQPAAWWRDHTSDRGVHAETVERRDDIRLPASSDVNIAVLPGKAATAENLARHRERREMVGLIRRLLADRFTWGDRATPITQETEKAAIAFIGLLPTATTMPKVSPDGEGGLLMVWEGPAQDPLLIVVDGWRIHMVTAATTPRAVYHDDLPFDGEHLPGDVLTATARR